MFCYSVCCFYLKIAGICDYLSFYVHAAVLILIGHRNLPHGSNGIHLIQHVTEEWRDREYYGKLKHLEKCCKTIPVRF